MFGSKHPKALPFLFLSEMWERFGYYLMIGIFTLYLKDTERGFGLNEAQASDLYGTFIALVFLTPFIGGLLADRVLGYRKSIIIGGILMGLGYMLMSVKELNFLYLSMTLIILGNGFFKPNISTLLGNVYNEESYKARKDAGYNIFYMGINIGAFVCNFFGAALYNMYGWYAAFLAAGVGMFIGVLVFIIGTKHYKHADQIKPKAESDLSLLKILGTILLPAIVFGLIPLTFETPLVGSKSTDAFLFGCIPVVFFYIHLYRKSPANEKPQIGAMLSIFAVVIAFWAIFKQNGSTMNTWAMNYTDREVPAVVEPLTTRLKLSEELHFVKDSVPFIDQQFRVLEKDKKVIDYPSYFNNQTQTKLPEQGATIKVFNTNLFQSVNPFWVIALTPLVVAFFAFLNRKGKEPSTPTKIAFGLLISALSCLVMVGAVYASNNGAEKSSAWWFISSYAVITIGELFLSPMGLSLVSKLSPARLTSLMMGGWFLATSIGNKLSGVLSSMWDGYDQKANFFYVNFVLLGLAALLLFGMLRKLNKVFSQY
ncbi:MAG: peptide MFS transporter [Crocinitomicaceae bacterium]|jgi:proton-dependent oligopeptide transporter, POT family|nr:peptide MFS transporter [Crocinitomicaceae bacterium]MDP4723049.1 peptide MFS transporter [Crocinitomicaceae bacterium]MDP4800325.1 peptide MFS transporter [Crocinitomicaceae bacterium]MDP4806659.1 peptide MFS transporter [Crocinitomicaceae bacterium]MDP4955864.1 peptide MFS transporter [Crocinitomicaceae bacterium]